MKTTPGNEPHSTEQNFLKHDYDDIEEEKPVQAEPPTSILIIDSDLKILSVNSAFESSSDFSIEELKGKYFYLYIAPEIVDIVLDFINQHKSDPSFPAQIQYEIDLIDKNSNLSNIIGYHKFAHGRKSKKF